MAGVGEVVDGAPAPVVAGTTSSYLLVPIPLDVQTELLSDIGDDLGLMWEAPKTPQEVRAKLSQLGFTELEVWAMATETKAGMREIIKKGIGLKDDAPLRLSIEAKLISSWQTAEIRGAKKKENEADQRVNELPRRLTANQHLELIRAFNKLHKELTEKKVPAHRLVEALLDQLEDGEMKAVRLSSVPAKDDVKEDQLGTARIDAHGAIQFSKTVTATVPIPANSEMFRRRIR